MNAILDKSKPLKVSGRLKLALDCMVWKGLTRKEAAKEANLTEHALYCALRKVHVKRYYLEACEVLRLSGRARRILRLDELAHQDENRNAAVAAIKAVEEMGSDQQAQFARQPQVVPGLQIVIVASPPPEPEPLTIDIEPEPDPDE
jgi:hypothetical protein